MEKSSRLTNHFSPLCFPWKQANKHLDKFIKLWNNTMFTKEACIFFRRQDIWCVESSAETERWGRQKKNESMISEKSQRIANIYKDTECITAHYNKSFVEKPHESSSIKTFAFHKKRFGRKTLRCWWITMQWGALTLLLFCTTALHCMLCFLFFYVIFLLSCFSSPCTAVTDWR